MKKVKPSNKWIDQKPTNQATSSHIKPLILQSETYMNKSDHQSKTKAVTPLAREENVYMAKLSEQA